MEVLTRCPACGGPLIEHGNHVCCPKLDEEPEQVIDKTKPLDVWEKLDA